MIEFSIQAFVTLFVIIDPLGITPIFVGLMAGAERKERARLALKSTMVAFFVLAAFALAGGTLLQTIGIGLPAFRIAGGLLLFLIALEMLFQKRAERRDKTVEGHQSSEESAEQEREARRDLSIFPMAVPLLAGPSAMTSMILLTEQMGGQWHSKLIVIAVTALVLVIAFVLLAMSHYVTRLLSRSAADLITRILGLLLAALAVQFVLDGLAAYGFSKL